MGVNGIHQLAQGAAQPKGQDHQETEVWRFLEGFLRARRLPPEVAQLDRLGRQHQVRRAESRGHGVHVGVAEDAARRLRSARTACAPAGWPRRGCSHARRVQLGAHAVIGLAGRDARGGPDGADVEQVIAGTGRAHDHAGAVPLGNVQRFRAKARQRIGDPVAQAGWRLGAGLDGRVRHGAQPPLAGASVILTAPVTRTLNVADTTLSSWPCHWYCVTRPRNSNFEPSAKVTRKARLSCRCGRDQHLLGGVAGLPVAGHAEGAAVVQAQRVFLGGGLEHGDVDLGGLAALEVRVLDGDGQVGVGQAGGGQVVGARGGHFQLRALGLNELRNGSTSHC